MKIKFFMTKLKKISVKVKRVRPHDYPLTLPQYQTAHAAGMDLLADIEKSVVIECGCRVLIPTGIAIELPEGYEAQIRPRSGLAIKQGISLVNTPGTIDADYRGEIKVILINLGQESVKINRGDRIAQMVVSPIVQAQLLEVTELDETNRSSGGFGSTGV